MTPVPHRLIVPNRSSGFLDNCFRCGTDQHVQVTDVQSVQDFSEGRNVLFPHHIHFAFCARDGSIVRKCKDIVILLCLLFMDR